MAGIGATDVAIFLGEGSPWDDWEIRLALRSWRRFFSEDLGRLVVIGKRPGWLEERGGLVHVPAPDPYRHNKDANLIAKLVRLAAERLVGPTFISSSDDHVLIAPVRLEEIRPWHEGDLLRTFGRRASGWMERLHRTRNALHQRGLPAWNFDTHVPQVIERGRVPVVLDYDWGVSPGMTIYTLYRNAAHAEELRETPPPHVNSERVRARFLGGDENRERSVAWKFENGNRFLNFTDRGRCERVRARVEALLPDPAPWEGDGGAGLTRGGG